MLTIDLLQAAISSLLGSANRFLGYRKRQDTQVCYTNRSTYAPCWFACESAESALWLQQRKGLKFRFAAKLIPKRITLLHDSFVDGPITKYWSTH